MRCIHWLASSSLRLAGSALAVLAAAVPAQQDRLRQTVERAAARLDDASTAADAARTLTNLGAPAVPLLCELLRAAGRDDTTLARKQRLVQVLAAIGRPALGARDALRELLTGGDAALAVDAAWALGLQAPWFDAAGYDLVRADLGACPTAVPASAAGRLLTAMLDLGPTPSPANLVAVLTTEPIAAARWIAAHATELGDAHDDLVAALRTTLDDTLVRPAIAEWSDRGTHAADVALALLALKPAPLDAATARALLEHWHPEQRRAAIAWFDDHGSALPLRERADLVSRLWDADPGLVRATAEALGRGGKAAFVALPALHLVAGTQEDAAAAQACRDAIHAIVAACADLPANDAAWIAALDRVLGGQATPLPARPCSPIGLELLHEALYLAQWNDSTSLGRVLNLVEAAGPVGNDAIRHVFAWLLHDTPGTVELATAWLARRGAQVQKAWNEAFPAAAERSLFAPVLRATCQHRVLDRCRRPAIEMMAQLLAADPWDRNHALLLDDGNSRVVAHTLAVAIAQRKGALDGNLARLRSLVYAPAATTMSVTGAAWDERTLPIDLGNHVRTLAAIALVDLGAAFDAPPDLDDVVHQVTGVPLAELGKHIAGLRETNQLRSLLDRIEDQCRLLMSVPPHLRWPSLAGTTR